MGEQMFCFQSLNLPLVFGSKNQDRFLMSSPSEPSKRWKKAVDIQKRKSATDLGNVLRTLGATPKEILTAVHAAETRKHFENSLQQLFNKVTAGIPKKESTIPKGNQ